MAVRHGAEQHLVRRMPRLSHGRSRLLPLFSVMHKVSRPGVCLSKLCIISDGRIGACACDGCGKGQGAGGLDQFCNTNIVKRRHQVASPRRASVFTVRRSSHGVNGPPQFGGVIRANIQNIKPQLCRVGLPWSCGSKNLRPSNFASKRQGLETTSTTQSLSQLP